MSAPVGRWLLIVTGAVVAASCIAAVAIMGGPDTQRELRLDQRRAHELQQIKREVREYWEANARLPRDLPALAAQPGVALSVADPETAQPYGYHPGESARYRLCARFAADTGDERRRDAMRYGVEWNWRHPAGPHCFELDAAKPAD
ncbi:hypothetical protein [Lysobacter antibioticus]|uniref:hypothetical protein n=1 Tax=Lysobacter antibioticus TaxID=84531 RepID=UPI0003457E70|nr:hypothetical protein [Lysobacter antibioticus]